MSAATDPRGLKRVCVECKSRFYDMNKRPIICPNCGVEFTLETKVKSKRSAKPAEAVEEKKADVANDDTEKLLTDDEAIESLDAIEDDDLDDEDLDDLKSKDTKSDD